MFHDSSLCLSLNIRFRFDEVASLMFNVLKRLLLIAFRNSFRCAFDRDYTSFRVQLRNVFLFTYSNLDLLVQHTGVRYRLLNQCNIFFIAGSFLKSLSRNLELMIFLSVEFGHSCLILSHRLLVEPYHLPHRFTFLLQDG